ncbi:MAG: hypothetical protein BECKG1743E_GA0114224_105224 [Candidatus Kentron sp. G]|nr:MAG: hypothetical protein BECKG1743E_GA0114224_105224 [Candidatus Kentron sp. G]
MEPEIDGGKADGASRREEVGVISVLRPALFGKD